MAVFTKNLQISFVEQGTVLDSVPRTLALDVGNNLRAGVIDHHQQDAPYGCTATLVLDYPQYITEHLYGLNQSEIEFILHKSPDFDCISSLFLSLLLIKGIEIDDAMKEIAKLTMEVDRGIFHLPKENSKKQWLPFENNPATLLQALNHAIHKDISVKNKYMQIIVEGIFLLNSVYKFINTGESIINNHYSKLSLYHINPAMELIKQDYGKYKADISNAEIFRIKLPKVDQSGFEEHDGLAIVNPESIFLRTWARNDYNNSQSGNGFTFLYVIFSGKQKKRYIISVDPRKNVNLRGLGAVLERKETDKRIHLGKEYFREGENRPGYSSPDPWYDGRSKLFNYTIVDTPRKGTVLIDDEIKDIFLDVDAWNTVKTS